MKLHFYLKTNCGYLDMSIWQTFSLKWTKWEYHFKENIWKYLLPIIKGQLSSENESLRRLDSTPMLKEFMMKSVVILTKVIIWHWNVSASGRAASFSEMMFFKQARHQRLTPEPGRPVDFKATDYRQKVFLQFQESTLKTTSCRVLVANQKGITTII